MSEIDWGKAPEGATHHYDERKAKFKWFKVSDGVLYRYHPNDGWEPSLRNPLPDPMCDLIPRPTDPCPTEWRGPEDGLPPVGTVCEVRCVEEWHRCTVVAHLKDHMGMTDAVFQAEDDWDFRQGPEMFRPIKSDKERAVEAALAQDCDPRDGMLSRHDFCARLYDAGLLRLPEEQS